MQNGLADHGIILSEFCAKRQTFSPPSTQSGTAATKTSTTKGTKATKKSLCELCALCGKKNFAKKTKFCEFVSQRETLRAQPLFSFILVLLWGKHQIRKEYSTEQQSSLRSVAK
jgi:hypothetical protein